MIGCSRLCQPWRRQESEVGGKAERVCGDFGSPPAWSRGRTSVVVWGLRKTAEFVLRIMLVNAYCSFYSSRNSHISDFQSLACSSFIHPPPLCVHTSHRICSNLRTESRAGWGTTTHLCLPPPGDANACQWYGWSCCFSSSISQQ